PLTIPLANPLNNPQGPTTHRTRWLHTVIMGIERAGDGTKGGVSDVRGATAGGGIGCRPHDLPAAAAGAGGVPAVRGRAGHAGPAGAPLQSAAGPGRQRPDGAAGTRHLSADRP